MIVGGGYIAVEFAGIFNGLGVETVLLYRGEQILRGFDDDLRNHLAAEMKKKGIDIRTNVLVVEDVRKVQSFGFDRAEKDLVLSLLSISFEPGEDGTGRVTLTLAGDGAVALDVEALEVRLDDVTRPYRAPSGKVPRHD